MGKIKKKIIIHQRNASILYTSVYNPILYISLIETVILYLIFCCMYLYSQVFCLSKAVVCPDQLAQNMLNYNTLKHRCSRMQNTGIIDIYDV